MPPRLVETRKSAERQGNAEGKDDWELYAGHRAAQTRELIAMGPAGGRVCLLGAGNCNDSDLEQLAGHYAEIHLVDIDSSALERAAARQTAATRAKLRKHGGIDLSGVLSALDQRKSPIRTFAEIEALLAPTAAGIVDRLPRGFDLVASCCIMTQLFHGIATAVGLDDPMLQSYQQAMSVIHLRTMATLARPGSTSVLLINDLVSNETHPVDHLGDDADLLALVDRLPDTVKVFEAANPVMIRRILRRDAVLRQAVGDPKLRAAWLWTAPLKRTYLVYSMSIAVRDGAP